MILIKNFPELRQTYSYDCGASALQSVLIYYGFKLREGEVMKLARTGKIKGTTPQGMLRALKKLQVKARLVSPMSLAELKRYIRSGRPVIVDLQAWAEKPKDYKNAWDEGHYAVAIAYDSQKIYFEDPACFSRTYLKWSELMERWHDQETFGRKYERLGLVVLGRQVDQNRLKIVHMD